MFDTFIPVYKPSLAGASSVRVKHLEDVIRGLTPDATATDSPGAQRASRHRAWGDSTPDADSDTLPAGGTTGLGGTGSP